MDSLNKIMPPEEVVDQSRPALVGVLDKPACVCQLRARSKSLTPVEPAWHGIALHSTSVFYLTGFGRATYTVASVRGSAR